MSFCDHGFENSGECGRIVVIIIITTDCSTVLYYAVCCLIVVASHDMQSSICRSYSRRTGAVSSQ